DFQAGSRVECWQSLRIRNPRHNRLEVCATGHKLERPERRGMIEFPDFVESHPGQRYRCRGSTQSPGSAGGDWLDQDCGSIAKHLSDTLHDLSRVIAQADYRV